MIELPGGEGIVRHDDGEIVLRHDITVDWGQPLQPHVRYQPIRIGLSDERRLFGGLAGVAYRGTSPRMREQVVPVGDAWRTRRAR